MRKLPVLFAAIVFLTACGSGQAGTAPTPQPEKKTEAPQLEREMEAPQTEESVESTCDNPIDAYFGPKMVSDYNVSESVRRSYQDTYRGVWRAEYRHLLKWLKKKCVYEEDRQNIENMDKALKKQITSMREVLATELLGNYKINPDSTKVKDGITRMAGWGNGTRSRLNQIEGEMYRDAAMKIINLCGDYKFRELNYAEVSYE